MREPRRLLEADPNADLTRALREARAHHATPARLDAWREQVAQRLGTAQPVAAPGLRAQTAGGLKALLLAGGLLVGLAVTATLLLRGVERDRTRELPRQPAARPSQQPRELTAAQAPSVTRPAPAQPPSDVSEPTQALGSQRASRAAAVPALRRPRYRMASPAQAPLPEAADPDAEVALISSAQQALDRDPQRTLGQLAEHERRFAHGVLAEEREILRVDALIALGRVAEAQARALAFVQRFPDSPQRRRFERWLASHAGVRATHNPSASHIPTE